MLHETHETAASQWICQAPARDVGKAKSYQSKNRFFRRRRLTQFETVPDEVSVSDHLILLIVMPQDHQAISKLGSPSTNHLDECSIARISVPLGNLGLPKHGSQ